MPVRLKLIYTIICFLCLSNKVIAQAVVLDPKSFPISISNSVLSHETIIVNGPDTIGESKVSPTENLYLGTLYKSLLMAVTLRLSVENIIDLNEPISSVLPDIVERNPFRVAVTPHHILTETAGFAVPAIISNAPLERYTSHVRTAGQMAHDDPVGWAVLIAYLERKTGSDIESIVHDEFLKPMGLVEGAFEILSTETPLRKTISMRGSVKLITEIVRLMIRNRDKDSERYLPPRLYDLIVKNSSWQMHPLLPARSYGGELHRLGGVAWLESAISAEKAGPSFMALPASGVAFINMQSPDEAFRLEIIEFARSTLLPSGRDNGLAEAALLDQYENFSGYYTPADTPTAWLRDRLRLLEQEQVHIRETKQNELIMKGMKGGVAFEQRFSKKAPFHFVSASGISVTLSPFKSGGYMVFDGLLYRYTGVLGNKQFVFDAFPLVIGILLSCAVYIRSKTGPEWRRMAQFGFVGTLCVCAGLYLDYHYWPSAIFVWDMPYIVTIWRIAMNVGLMLILSLPLFAISFTKRNKMPQGPALLFVPFHMAALSIASAMLFLILVAWGSAAEFSAY